MVTAMNIEPDATEAPPPKLLDPLERFKVEYKEVGDYIRHYSNVRSALTTFLITVSLASFSAYFNKQQTSPFFLIVGHLLLVTATVVCLNFSCRTERSNLYQTKLWNFYVEGEGFEPEGFKSFKPANDPLWRRKFIKKVLTDLMNWLLILVMLAIFISFWITEGQQAGKFALALVVIMALVICASSVTIFMISSSTRHGAYWPEAFAVIGLSAMGVGISHLLLGSKGLVP